MALGLVPHHPQQVSIATPLRRPPPPFMADVRDPPRHPLLPPLRNNPPPPHPIRMIAPSPPHWPPPLSLADLRDRQPSCTPPLTLNKFSIAAPLPPLSTFMADLRYSPRHPFPPTRTNPPPHTPYESLLPRHPTGPPPLLWQICVIYNPHFLHPSPSKNSPSRPHCPPSPPILLI